MSLINTQVKPFEATGYVNGEFKDFSSQDISGKWAIFFFYPADFTFVCPTELGDLADYYDELKGLGVEVFSTAEVAEAQRRLAGEGLATADESGVCCYAQQEKVWVNDPDGAPWEIYTVLADSDVAGSGTRDLPGDGGVCCAGDPVELADVAAGEKSVSGCC